MLIYGGSAYSYANDPDFQPVSTSQKFWQRVIDDYYTKYHGIAKWHAKLIQHVRENKGILAIPSGRQFCFEPNFNRREPWPITQIKNYPVQGWGADLVKLARIEAYRQFKSSKMEGYFIQTIHDSLKFDVPTKNVDATVKILRNAVAKIPELCYNNWDWEFSLPMTCEVKVGMNSKDMEEIPE